MKTTTIIILSVLLLTGCGVKRQQQSAMRQTQTTERRTNDSLAWQQLSLGKGERKATIRVVRLARPDSLGWQPIESIAEIEIEECSSQKDSLWGVRKQTETERKEETVSSLSYSKRKINLLSQWPLIVYLGLAVLFFLFVRQEKRKNR